MRRTTLPSITLGVIALTALAGCGSSSPSANPPASPTNSSSPSSTPTTPFQRESPSTSAAVAVDLHVTNALRAQLVAAGAKEKSLTASDFTGLRPGLTYYAYDNVTKTYWAGAALVPSPRSQAAMVSVQDDGSYTLFHRQAGTAWIAGDTGMLGSAPANSPCGSASPPAAIVAIWGWPPHTCHPPNS